MVELVRTRLEGDYYGMDLPRAYEVHIESEPASVAVGMTEGYYVALADAHTYINADGGIAGLGGVTNVRDAGKGGRRGAQVADVDEDRSGETGSARGGESEARRRGDQRDGRFHVHV